MKVKVNEIINKILNSKKFVFIIIGILFFKTIYFYKNTIAISEIIQLQTIIGTTSFVTSTYPMENGMSYSKFF